MSIDKWDRLKEIVIKNEQTTTNDGGRELWKQILFAMNWLENESQCNSSWMTDEEAEKLSHEYNRIAVDVAAYGEVVTLSAWKVVEDVNRLFDERKKLKEVIAHFHALKESIPCPLPCGECKELNGLKKENQELHALIKQSIGNGDRMKNMLLNR